MSDRPKVLSTILIDADLLAVLGEIAQEEEVTVSDLLEQVLWRDEQIDARWSSRVYHVPYTHRA